MKRWSMLTIALLSALTVTAQSPCSTMTRGASFRTTRAAIEENCPRAFTQDEQLFLAGIAQRLLTTCKLPRDADARARMERFTTAAAMALALRESATVRTQTSGSAAFATGVSMMDDVRCRSPEAALLSRGIVLYLRRTSQSSRFVAGCAERYGGQYDQKQCACVADTLRSGRPDIDDHFFDRALIKRAIHESPWIALRLLFSCGMGRY